MVDHYLKKRNDEHTHKCDDWTEEYLVWKKEKVTKPEVFYVSYMFILAWDTKTMTLYFSWLHKVKYFLLVKINWCHVNKAFYIHTYKPVCRAVLRSLCIVNESYKYILYIHLIPVLIVPILNVWSVLSCLKYWSINSTQNIISNWIQRINYCLKFYYLKYFLIEAHLLPRW